MTLVACILITCSLLYFLYATCTDGTFVCDSTQLPMISDTLCLPFYDRIFCLFSTFMMYCCFQVDIRAFYNLLDGIATPKQNNWLLFLGFLATIALPGIGYFDEHNYRPMHILLAATFFASTGFYAWILAGVLSSHKLKFPTDMWVCIALLKKVRVVMMGSLLAFLYFEVTQGSYSFWAPFFEWLSVILFLNFFAFVSFMNKYYQSVLPVTPEATKQNNFANTI
eukprot:CAMPEP_0202956112 /NCGR_PEP_ID=MMETSP1396-20130829/664_1 /ASSEMBLY_ACC=CAM_ASM_000872 /TAXON_ID= /ORGANISM="Pseudokeronopsis sp., Strain Brazil" /LENGTH=223 /DNA_ID=CAMNT_0049672995 /DNA_START=163 /DNA_END=834 /DNA_ORIENTATION=+